MDKIKIKEKKQREKITFIGGKIVKVKSFIAAEDIPVFCSMCVNSFLDNGENKYELFPTVRQLFEVCVINSNTNIDIDGLTISQIAEMGIIKKIKRLITNYDEVYSDVKEAINLLNINISLTDAMSVIPNEEEMNKNIKETSELISKLNKDDPDTLKKIVETGMVVTELKDSKENFNKKAKTLKEERTEILNTDATARKIAKQIRKK